MFKKSLPLKLDLERSSTFPDHLNVTLSNNTTRGYDLTLTTTRRDGQTGIKYFRVEPGASFLAAVLIRGKHSSDDRSLLIESEGYASVTVYS